MAAAKSVTYQIPCTAVRHVRVHHFHVCTPQLFTSRLDPRPGGCNKPVIALIGLGPHVLPTYVYVIVFLQTGLHSSISLSCPSAALGGCCTQGIGLVHQCCLRK